MPLPKPEREPTLAGALTGAIEKRLLQVHTCIPAKVERWDPVKGLVDAKPLVMAYKRGEDGERIPYPLPVVANAPALFFGAGGFRQTYPVEVGDFALLLFAEASLDVWLERGVDVDPEDERRHHLSDGIALLGLRPATSPWTGLESPSTTWGKDGGLQISISGVEMLLGTAAVDALLKGTSFISAFNSWRTALNTLLTALATLNPTNIAPAATAYTTAEGVFSSALSSVLSTKVKTE